MKKLVYIGGGGGVTNMVPGLRDDFIVTAIMTVFDNGGSYGRLRQDFGHVLTGDVRRALGALSSHKLAKLAEYRFEKGELKGHTLGNLLLTAAYENSATPQLAMQYLHDCLAVKGQVLPVSYDLADLRAELVDGTILTGEHRIDEPHAKSHVPIKSLCLYPNQAQPGPGVLQAIKEADFIILGPGDLYCSLIPNLLVLGVSQAIADSAACKLYFANIFSTNGQTNHLSTFEHVQILEKYFPQKTIDTVVLNSSEVRPELIKYYKNRSEEVISCNIAEMEQAGYTVLTADLLANQPVSISKADLVKRSQFFNDPSKVRAFFRQL